MRTVISDSAIAGSRLYAWVPTTRYNCGLVADWVTISALATAGGTLVLAGTTYASVRSANRAARVAETSLLAGLRPLIMQSAPDDRTLDAGFMDNITVHVEATATKKKGSPCLVPGARAYAFYDGAGVAGGPILLADDFVRPRLYTDAQAVELARLLLRDNVRRIFNV